MKKNLLRKWSFLLLSFVILMLYSCRTDLYENLNHHDAQRNVSRISFSQFKKEIPQKSISQDIMVDMIREADGHLSHKGEEQLSMATFRMDTARVQRLEMDGMTAYSMAAYNYMDPASQLYNVVYFSKDGEVHYTIHEIHANKTSSTVYDSRFPSKVFVSNPEISASICLEPYQSLEWACKNSEPIGSCDGCPSCFKVVVRYTSAECGSGGGPGGGYDDGGDPDLPGPGTGTGTGTGGGPPSDPSHYFFDPLGDPSDPFQIRSTWAKMFWHHLDNDDKEWTNEHPNKYMAILEHYLDHLDKYGYMGNEQNEAHHKWLIQILRNNPNYEWQYFYNQFLANPCEKTQVLIQKPEVKTKLDQLYNKAKSTSGGEIGFMMKKDGTPGNIIQGDGHSVTLNNIDQHTGAYHNHTNKKGEEGIKMVSPKDIHRLFQFVTLQDAGTTTSDAFVGMIGAEPCAVANDCRPDGYEMFNYVIRFNGTKQEAQTVYNKSYDFTDLKDKYGEFEMGRRNKSGYSSQYGTYMGNKGLEELFFDTLGNMGIDKNQMILQRIDKNGNITNITQGADGKPEGTACP